MVSFTPPFNRLWSTGTIFRPRATGLFEVDGCVTSELTELLLLCSVNLVFTVISVSPM